MCFPIWEVFNPLSKNKTALDKIIQQLKFGKEDIKDAFVRELKKSLSKIPLPTIILANVQSLQKKTDELQAMVKFQHDYRNVCLMALTETWLSEGDSDLGLRLDDFGIPVRMDRDARETCKVQGGGVCLYIRENWCKSVSVKERVCTKDIELLTVALRPQYLPCEFPQLFVTVVYIHSRANEDNAAREIERVVHELQSVSPDAPSFILGDFNNCTLEKSLGHFNQYVTCPTRKDTILDLCYGSIKGAYKLFGKPPLGTSDHNTVLLVPTYKTVLKR